MIALGDTEWKKEKEKLRLHLEEKEKLSQLLQGLDRSDRFHQLNYRI